MTTQRTRTRPTMAYLLVVSFLLSAASAPIAIRYAQLEGVPSLYIILVRLLLISMAITPYVWRHHRHELQALVPRDWGWAVSAGILHGLGVALLFFSLEYTSILVSAVMRRTSPLWVIAIEMLFLHAVFSRQVWFGMILTIIGTIFVGLGGATAIEGGSHPLFGAALAALTAVANAVYLIIGRKLRHKLSFMPYSLVVFGSAALFMLACVLLTNTPLSGYSAMGYFWIVAVAIIAQLFGHLPINASLQYFAATELSVGIQLSVVLSAVLAAIFLGEIPSSLQLIGSVVAIAGVMLVVWRKV